MLPWISEQWANLFILDELKKLEPTLELQRADGKVLSICCSDFKNYMEYLEYASVGSKPVMPTSIEVNFASGDSHYVTAKEGDIEDVVEFIQVWVRGWWKKYKIRVALAIETSPRFKPSKLVAKGARVMRKFSEDEIEDIKKAVVQTLIKNGEICCTEILADSLFKKLLGGYSGKTEWTQEKKLNLMASIIREAKRMSYTHGPLIFIKPDKRYYELREFRNDNASSTV